MKPRILRALFVTVLVLFLVGCGSNPPQFTLRGGPDLNAGGNAATVKVYQLNSSTAFNARTVATFWQDDVNALGSELVSSRSFILYPNDEETFELELEEATRYVGIAADLREPDRERWRAIFPVDDVRGREVTVSVDSTKLNVAIDGRQQDLLDSVN